MPDQTAMAPTSQRVKHEYNSMACSLYAALTVLALLNGVSLTVGPATADARAYWATVFFAVLLLVGLIGYCTRQRCAMLACQVYSYFHLACYIFGVIAIVFMVVFKERFFHCAKIGCTTEHEWLQVMKAEAIVTMILTWSLARSVTVVWAGIAWFVAVLIVCKTMSRARKLAQIQDPAVPFVVGVYGAVEPV